MLRHKHLIFDFDGTIADLQVDWSSLREEVFSLFNDRYGFAGKQIPYMYQVIFDGDVRDREELLGVIRRYEQPGGRAIFSPVEAVARLLRDVAAFYVISNNMGSTIRQVLGTMSLLHSCRAVIGVDDVKAVKPSPIPFNALTDAVGLLARRDCLYVGDRETDQQFAAEIGIDFLHVGEVA